MSIAAECREAPSEECLGKGKRGEWEEGKGGEGEGGEGEERGEGEGGEGEGGEGEGANLKSRRRALQLVRQYFTSYN